MAIVSQGGHVGCRDVPAEQAVIFLITGMTEEKKKK